MAKISEVNLADKFVDDIKKNLQKWVPKGQSVFYLTNKNWYQFRKHGNSIHCVRQDIKTHKVDRSVIMANRISIGKEWLQKPAQAKKQGTNFFSFVANIQRR